MLLGKYGRGKALVTVSDFRHDQDLSYLSTKLQPHKHPLFTWGNELKFNYVN